MLNHLYQELKEITHYNEVMPHAAFTIEHYGVEVSNFFYDETYRFEVNPIEYYNLKDLQQVVQNWREQ